MLAQCLQLSFLGLAYPVLVLTYLGQAAWLTAFPDQVSSTFYASIPFGDGFYWVCFVCSTLIVNLVVKMIAHMCQDMCSSYTSV